MVHSTKMSVTTMLTYSWKCAVLHCNHLGNTWKPLVLMTRHFDYCPSTSEGDNQSVRSSAPVVSRCFPGGYNVKLHISRGRLAWWLLAFLHSGTLALECLSTQCIWCKDVIPILHERCVHLNEPLKPHPDYQYKANTEFKRWQSNAKCNSTFIRK